MKKVIVMTILLVASISTISVAQSEKYTKKMKELVAKLDTSKTTAEYADLSATFERIASAEKTQWLPYYYASLTLINATTFSIANPMGDNTAITDPAADKAQELLDKALALTTETSETWVVKKMLYGLRMMGNPMQRFMQWGTKAADALKKAKELDATNPRVYLLEGQDKFYTPEAFGGSKTEAKKLFEKAKELYATFKPATDLHPKWGANQAVYFLTQAK